MALSVTPNAVTGLFTDKLQAADGQQPIVQVLDIKEIPTPSNAANKGPRYRLIVSDGDAFLQAMAGSDTAAQIVAGTIKTYALLQLKGYTMNQVSNKRVLVVIAVDVVGQLDKKIGTPVAVDKAEAKADGDAPMPAAAPAAAPAPAAAAAGAGARPAAAAAAAAAAPAKPFASPPAKAGGASQSSPATQLAREGNVRPISSLNPYQRGWAIKARVSAKSGERTWNSKNGGSGKLMSVDLVDSHGGQIRATMFNAAVDKFGPILQEKGVYIIAKGVLKVANARFNKLPNDYEITLNEDAEVVPVADAGEIKMQQFDFVPFADIQGVKAETHIDVLGVVTKAGDASEITGRQSGKQMMRRALTLVDKTGHSIELTLWGEDAKNYDKSKLNDEERPILAVKAVRVSDFGGKSLSTSFQSRIYVNPTDVPEAAALRQWYDGEGKEQTPHFMSGERQGSTAGPVPRKTFSAIKDEKLGLTQVVQNPNTGKPGSHRNGDYFTVRGTVVYYRSDMQKPPYYLACPTDKCGRKVTENGGVSHCANCNKNVTPAPRYILSLLACDHTGGYWLTAFNEQAQKMLNRSAKDLHDLKMHGNEEEFKAVFAARNFLPFVFRVRAQEDTGRDGQGAADGSGEQRVRVHVMDAQPLEGKVLVAEMQQLAKDLEATLGPL